MPHPYSAADARSFLATSAGERAAGRRISLAVVEASSGSLLGSVALRVDWEDRIGEIGYWVAAHARRRGVGARTVRLLARWAFGALALERVQILTDPANLPSQRVAERAGFTREGLLRSYREHKGGRKDFVVYSLLRNDP